MCEREAVICKIPHLTWGRRGCNPYCIPHRQQGALSLEEKSWLIRLAHIQWDFSFMRQFCICSLNYIILYSYFSSMFHFKCGSLQNKAPNHKKYLLTEGCFLLHWRSSRRCEREASFVFDTSNPAARRSHERKSKATCGFKSYGAHNSALYWINHIIAPAQGD